jgi:hypothetical protein
MRSMAVFTSNYGIFLPHSFPHSRHSDRHVQDISIFRRNRRLGCSHSKILIARSSISASHTTSSSQLISFVQWLQANGAEGLGHDDSKLALYEGDNNERGIACVKPIKNKEQLVKLPLYLSIADHPDDEDISLYFPPSLPTSPPWNVRLASKLLRLRAQGQDCPFFPYLRVLPITVPRASEALPWDATSEIEYQPALDALFNASWIESDGWQYLKQIDPEIGVCGGADREEWAWALSVVHSRTFGAAGTGGGINVRLMVPFIDMLNHGGDVFTSPHGQSSSLSSEPSDSVRWDVVKKLSGDWIMVLSATRDISPGEEVLLSYGEKENDDFFVHYGFCPCRNPHDRYGLFDSLSQAVDWYVDMFVVVDDDQVAPDRIKESALLAAKEAEVIREIDAGKYQGMSSSESDQITRIAQTVKAAPGGQVDADVALAFNHLATQHPIKSSNIEPSKITQLALKLRALQCLSKHKAPLERDLEALSTYEKKNGGEYKPHDWEGAFAHYVGGRSKDRLKALSTLVHSMSDGIANVAIEEGGMLQTVAFRAYKKMILHDLLWTEESEEEWSLLSDMFVADER